MTDLYLFSEEHLLKQLEQSEYTFGFYTVSFYSLNGRPSDKKTESKDEFYLYPSGGTLRDKNMNIIFYSSKFDTYRGFRPPHLNRT